MPESSGRQPIPTESKHGLLALIIVLGGSLGLLPSVPAAPSIDRVTPMAIAPGTTTTTLHVRGENFDDSAWLWTSFPAAITRNLKPSQGKSETLDFQITPGPSVETGLGAIRIVSQRGVSELVLIAIDELSTVQVAGDHHSREQAQSLTFPGAVEDRMESLKLDYYVIEGRAGQTVSVEVMAARLGSQLDPLLRILDEEGRELAYMDDEPGIRPDLRLRHTFAKDGRCWVELRDVAYQGGGGSFYRLRVGDFPLVTVPYPMSVTSGQKTDIQLLGRGLGGLTDAGIRLPPQSEGGYWKARTGPDGNSSYVQIRCLSGAVQLEREPNDEFSNATPAAHPVLVTGRLEQDMDRDYYRFKLKENDQLQFTSRTRTAGSPCDIWMQIEDANGKSLAECKIADSVDTRLTFKAPSTGIYALMVEELNRMGGPDFAYEIDIQSQRPTFSLLLDSDRSSAAPGESVSLKVLAERSGCDEPIEISVQAGNQYLNTENSVIEAKKTETTLEFRVPEDWAWGRLVPLQVVGKADMEGKRFIATASIRPALEKQFRNTRFFPPGLEKQFVLGVARKD